MKTYLLVSLIAASSLTAINSARSEGLAIMRAIELKVDTVAGKNYSLQSSTNLAQWIDEQRITGTGLSAFMLKSIRDSEERYYRLQPIAYPEYWPLVVGSQWTYEPGFGQGPRVDSITGVETVQGVLCYKWERQETSPDNYHEIRWLFPNQGTVTMYQIASNEEPLLTAGTPFQPPWLIVKPAFAPAESWSQQQTINGSLINLNTTVNSTNSTASVPAGTFANCLVLRYHHQITSGGTTQQSYAEEWFAPGVGRVLYNKYSDAWITLKQSQKLTGYRIGSN